MVHSSLNYFISLFIYLAFGFIPVLLDILPSTYDLEYTMTYTSDAILKYPNTTYVTEPQRPQPESGAGEITKQKAKNAAESN